MVMLYLTVLILMMHRQMFRQIRLRMHRKSVVELTMNSSGASKFATATKYAYSQTYGSTGNQIAIVYDGQIVSAPCVEAEISDGKAVISGMDDFDEAKNIASTIRIGALPVELQEIRAQVVGAKLGANSISQSLLAGMVGLILVILLCLLYSGLQDLLQTLPFSFMLRFCYSAKWF